MPKCYQLIGVPGAGKSTWVWSQTWIEGMDYVSTDHHVEVYAKEQGKTYSEVFTDYMPRAVELMAEEVVVAREAGRDIIWDQTNLTVKARKKKLNKLHGYRKVAVVCTTPSDATLSARLSTRPGKHIPNRVVYQMKEDFTYPSLSEGFINIIEVNND